MNDKIKDAIRQTQTKPALKSDTVKGALLSIISGAYATKTGVETAQPEIIATGLTGVIGGLLSLWGRLKATDIISGWF